MSNAYEYQRTATESESSEVWSAGSTDLREGERNRESGSAADGSGARDFAQRMARKTWSWASLAIRLTGGILDQLIEDVRDQLVAHQESADWYQAEIQKNEAGRDWHLARVEATQTRLRSLLELQASIASDADNEEGTEASDL